MFDPNLKLLNIQSVKENSSKAATKRDFGGPTPPRAEVSLRQAPAHRIKHKSQSVNPYMSGPVRLVGKTLISPKVLKESCVTTSNLHLAWFMTWFMGKTRP